MHLPYTVTGGRGTQRDRPGLVVPKRHLRDLEYQLSFDRRSWGRLTVPVEPGPTNYDPVVSTNPGTDPWKETPVGVAFTPGADTTTQYITTDLMVAFRPQGTMLWLAAPGNTAGFLGSDSTPTSAKRSFGFYWRGSSNYYYLRIMEEGESDLTALAAPAGIGGEDVWSLVGFSWGPAGWQIWHNGRLIASNAVKTAALYSTDPAGQYVNFGKLTTNYGLNAYSWFGMWTRQLDERAHMDLQNARLRLIPG